MRLKPLLSLSIPFLCPLLGAAVLYEPTPIGSSVRTADYASSTQNGFRVFDNFRLTSGGIIEKVTWRGIFIDFANPDPAPAPSPDVSVWQLSFHADSAGLPGMQEALESFAAASVTSTFQGTGLFNAGGTYRVSFYEYSVSLTTPFQAAAGTQYWFGLLGLSENFNPAFALRGASGGDNSSVQQTLGAGMSVTSTDVRFADRAIKLEGVELPEPSTYALCGSALFLAIGIRRGRAGRGAPPANQK